jgi:hypothetical protein
VSTSFWLGCLVGIGLPFSSMAGAMAFLITYHEYRRHYPDERPARSAAIRVGLVTTLSFLALSVAAGLTMWVVVSRGIP